MSKDSSPSNPEWVPSKSNSILAYLLHGFSGRWLIIDNKECKFLATPLTATNKFELARNLYEAYLFTDEEMRYTMADNSDLTAIKA